MGRIRMGTIALVAAGMVGTMAFADDAKRPRDPWVFRSVLDGRARMLTCAMNDKLYVSYDTQTSTLYRAWSGSVLFTGGVYDARHGPQPKSVGPAYYRHKGEASEWTVTADGKDAVTKPHYLGYKVSQDTVTISFTIDTPGGKVTIDETPGCEVSGDKVTLVRTFNVSGLPAGSSLSIGLTGEDGDPVAEQHVDSTDTTTPPAVIDRLRLDRNGTTRLRTTWSTR